MAERVVGFFRGERWFGLRVHRRLMETDQDYREAFHVWASVRGYKAAQPGSSKTPWLNASDRSADGDLIPDLPTLRNRARAVQRDDPVGSGIIGTMVRKVVGTGIRFQTRTGDDKKDAAIEEVEAEILAKLDQANDLDWAAHQRLIYQRSLEDGDVLLRAVVSEPFSPIWVEVIEGERLGTPMDAKPRDPAGRIVAGVEKDRHGRPVAYWAMKRHPHEYFAAETVHGPQAKLGVVPLSMSEFHRIPAAQCKLLRSRITRAGQTRGVTLLHAVLQDVHDLGLLIHASLKRTQVAACLAMFITSPGDSLDILELTAEEYGYRLDQQIEPGMMFRLFPGEKAEFLNPTAGAPGLDEFVMLLARRIGAAVGLSPQSILRNWDGVSYSGARTIKTDEKQTVLLERSVLVGQALLWERRAVLEDALLRGEPRLLRAGVTSADLADRFVQAVGDEEEWVDPQAEASATEKMLTMGLTSLQIECARLGRDWQDVMRQNVEAERERERLKIENMVGAAAKFTPSTPLPTQPSTAAAPTFTPKPPGGAPPPPAKEAA